MYFVTPLDSTRRINQNLGCVRCIRLNQIPPLRNLGLTFGQFGHTLVHNAVKWTRKGTFEVEHMNHYKLPSLRPFPGHRTQLPNLPTCHPCTPAIGQPSFAPTTPCRRTPLLYNKRRGSDKLLLSTTPSNQQPGDSPLCFALQAT